jgi:hypothetical protein
MSALICQRPSSIDRRDKRLGNGHARARRHRIKRAVGPIRPRAFRVRANYLDALNASRVRIHRQKPKAQVRLRIYAASPPSSFSGFGDIDLSEVALLPLKLKQGPGHSITALAASAASAR